jgi:hypothetical protein
MNYIYLLLLTLLFTTVLSNNVEELTKLVLNEWLLTPFKIYDNFRDLDNNKNFLFPNTMNF